MCRKVPVGKFEGSNSYMRGVSRAINSARATHAPHITIAALLSFVGVCLWGLLWNQGLVAMYFSVWILYNYLLFVWAHICSCIQYKTQKIIRSPYVTCEIRSNHNKE